MLLTVSSCCCGVVSPACCCRSTGSARPNRVRTPIAASRRADPTACTPSRLQAVRRDDSGCLVPVPARLLTARPTGASFSPGSVVGVPRQPGGRYSTDRGQLLPRPFSYTPYLPIGCFAVSPDTAGADISAGHVWFELATGTLAGHLRACQFKPTVTCTYVVPAVETAVSGAFACQFTPASSTKLAVTAGHRGFDLAKPGAETGPNRPVSTFLPANSKPQVSGLRRYCPVRHWSPAG